MLRAKARKKKQGGNDDFDDDFGKKEKEKDTFGGRKKMKKRKSGKDGSLLKDVVAIGILICFFLFVVSLYFKEPRGQKVFVKTKTEKNKKRLKTKVIAIGDVHGDEDVLRRLLFATGATDKVLVDIGTGYFVEKTPKGAEEYCKKKVQELRVNMERIMNVVQQKRKQLVMVSEQLSKRGQ